MRDPGLQAERTALAWSRTAWLVSANALLMLRIGLQHGDHLLLGLCGIFLSAAAWFAHTGRRRRQALVLASAPQAPSGLDLATVSLVTCAITITVGWVLTR